MQLLDDKNQYRTTVPLTGNVVQYELKKLTNRWERRCRSYTRAPTAGRLLNQGNMNIKQFV
jgi:hypothetical protein